MEKREDHRRYRRTKCSASCWTSAEAGDNIGALLRGVAQRDRARPGSGQARHDSSPHQVHRQVYVLTKEEGGRHTPFFNNYRPQFYFRTTDVTGIITCPTALRCACPAITST